MPAKIIDNDDLLLKMLAANDKQAINILYRKHCAHLLNIINGIVHDTEASKDILQDLFVALWERRGYLKIAKPIKAYLVKSAVHRSFNFIRDNARRQTVHFREQEILGPSKSNKPLGASPPIELEELRDLIRSAILGLPQKDKAAFILSRNHGMSYSEIASHLGISKKAVEKRISKALKYLGKILKPYLKSFLLLILL